MNKPASRHVLLLVDDDAENIEIVNSILCEKYEVRVATNGVKALELVNRQPTPSLVLLDVIMPHMDGYEVCKHLKENPKTRDIPVIFLTGKTDVTDALWLADLLAHGLIRASFVPDPATQEMRALLRTRKQLVREAASHVQRLQKTLEDANIKLASVLTNIMGVSDRKSVV